MKRSIIFILLTAVFALRLLWPVEQVRIKTLIDDPYRFRQETVLVVGEVAQYGEGKTKYSKFYYLKGNWGGIIKIITDIEMPEINKRYEVRGIAVISDKGEVNIIERARNIIEQPVKETKDGDTRLPQKEDKKWMYYLVGLAALLLIVVIILVVFLVSNKRKANYVTPIPGTTGISRELTNLPEAANVLEGSTIKMAAPPVGTLKLLPGRFEVVSGDDTIKEIRFYKAKNRDETEITFGRGAGPDYFHIQLKPMTVSIKQAKLLWTNRNYKLTNYSVVNPTIVNGEPLAEESLAVLKDGDKIEMGEVVFIFHEK